jgi:hypothetical protein
MKFDMSAAWSEAMRLIGANRDVLLVVAGVFFFLPYTLFMILFTNQMKALEAAQGVKPDPEAMGQALLGFYGDVWWIFVIVFVMQGIGMLGLLALLTDRSRPTVGQALGIGARLLLPYIGAQLILSFAMGLLMLIPIAVGAAGSVAAAVIVGIAAVVAIAYVFTKFLLVPPVIAIERVMNPLAALGRSWRLTKGNSVRLFVSVFLLVIAYAIVGSVVSMVAGLVFALAGPQGALIGQAIASGLLNAAFVTTFLAVLAAIHRQLAGPSPETIGETFS